MKNDKMELYDKWFDQLHNSQIEDSKVFQKDRYVGFVDSAIDIYCDSAHFIYELLQNADDAGATEVEMILTKDYFIFKHNGKERFTISDPHAEKEDKENNRLGHINAITAIGFSSKNQKNQSSEDEEIKIGKFGVGFKAVFQYTTTPYIYDKPFCFKIENHLIPTRIEDSLYEEGKTVFKIPFDKKEITPKKAYEDIEKKIKGLQYPQLFLFNINSITWKTSTEEGRIEKKVVKKFKEFRDISTTQYLIKNTMGEDVRILLMSRKVEVPDNGKHVITIGYFLDKRGCIDTEKRENINCFFPTQENIKTCYVIHAPFSVVENRQQIKRDNDVNTSLLKSVGKLAADSIVLLKELSVGGKRRLLNDNIFELMCHDTTSVQEDYYGWDRDAFSFGENYKNVLAEEAVFLSKNKEYLTKSQGRWADSDMRKLLSSNQLDFLTKCNLENFDEDVKYDFILCTLNTTDREWIQEYEIEEMTDKELASKLNTEFMGAQSDEWLSAFYKYVVDHRLVEKHKINAGRESEAVMRHGKIVKNACGEFVAPYDEDDKLQVFFKAASIQSKNTINSDLYDANENFRKLIETLGVEKPSVCDSIRVNLEDCQDGIDNQLLTEIINYSESCSMKEWEELVKLLKEKLRLRCKEINGEDESLYSCSVAEMVDDNEMLLEYYRLSDVEGKYCIDRKTYQETIDNVKEDVFNRFMDEFKLPKYPQKINMKVTLSGEELRERRYVCHESQKDVVVLEGLKVFLEQLDSSERQKELSHFLWETLVYCLQEDGSFFREDVTKYKYYIERSKSWGKCTMVDWLRNYKWLHVGGCLVSIEDGIYQEDILPEGYQHDEKLFSGLRVERKPVSAERESISQMSEETQASYAMGECAKAMGIGSLEELAEALKEYAESIKDKENQKEAAKKPSGNDSSLPKRKKSKKFEDNDFDEDGKDEKKIAKSKSPKEPMNLEKALAGFDEKANLQREEIERAMFLRDYVEKSQKYSFGWFKSLMELEAQSSGKCATSGKRTISIMFEDVRVDENHSNRLVLSGASRDIPSMLEDVDGIPVTFHFKDGRKQTVIFDNACVREDALVVRGNSKVESLIRPIVETPSGVSRATIDADKPIKLVERWKRMIDSLPFATDDVLKDKMRTDLKFIFGPPGTGKTTTLAKRIVDLIDNKEKCRILVLAPTNKACDVVAKKVLELCPQSLSWLWRFVATMDPELEDEGVVRSYDAEILSQEQVCVISTMARYSFDGFADELICEVDWDFVIIDEASMVPLYQIIPPIFNKKSGEIWIAGDPFQIEPIVNIDIWKDENIYKMVDLNDFATHKTTPVQFDVELLMTQYRSIPIIGEVYSQYMYGSKLRHYRSAASHRVLDMGLRESPLNIISFPVTKDSIFEPKRVNGSNIHIYSVLFSVEFLKYIVSHLSKGNRDEKIKIGVLSPYGVEVQSIQKLYEQTSAFYENVEVSFGTSHGFQGDQCDIVIVVMNPPASGLKRNAYGHENEASNSVNVEKVCKWLI